MLTTNEKKLHFQNPPIVEVIVDIDCELPPNSLDFTRIREDIGPKLMDEYPEVRERHFYEHRYQNKDNAASMDVEIGIEGLQFRNKKGVQLIQIRRGGYSFNRLSPYTSFCDYLPEIEKTWNMFLEIMQPISRSKVSLRTINNIKPHKLSPGLKWEECISSPNSCLPELMPNLLTSLNQYLADDPKTENRIGVAIGVKKNAEDFWDIVLDIDAFDNKHSTEMSWDYINPILRSLRELKNRVFVQTVTQKCQNYF